MRPGIFTVLLTLGVLYLTSCGNRHVTENTATVEPEVRIAPGQVDNVQRLTEGDVNNSGGETTKTQKAIAASSYLRILSEKRDSVSAKAIEPVDISVLIQKRAEILQAGETSGKTSDSIVRSVDFLKKFSVVAGSFSKMENTLLQIKILKALVYEPFIVKNENGMFRVITGTFDEKVDAYIQSFSLKNDSIASWILKK